MKIFEDPLEIGLCDPYFPFPHLDAHLDARLDAQPTLTLMTPTNSNNTPIQRDFERARQYAVPALPQSPPIDSQNRPIRVYFVDEEIYVGEIFDDNAKHADLEKPHDRPLLTLEMEAGERDSGNGRRHDHRALESL
jgi:hypothetical protein